MKDINYYSKNTKNINYIKYIIYIQFIYNYNLKIRKQLIYENNYDNLCQKMLLYNSINIDSNIAKLFSEKKINSLVGLFRNYYYNIIIKQINSNNNLIITNTFPILKHLNNFNLKFSVQLFENEEMSIKKFIEYLKKIKQFKNVEQLENNIIYNFLLQNKYIKKYDTIICKINEFFFSYYFKLFTLTKIPNILFVIVQALKQLHKNGDLYLFFRIGIMNQTYQKIIHLLINSFKKVEVIHNNYDKNDSNIVLHCKSFIDNVSKQRMNKLTDICLKNRKNNYTLCQFMHYFYYMSKTQTDKSLLYPFDYKDIGDVKESEIKQKTMPILDDIDINPKKSKAGAFVIYQMEQLYEDYFDNVNYNTTRYIKEVDGKIEVDKSFFDKKLYDQLIFNIKYMEENKIPYNKTYLAYINKYNKNLIKDLYSFKDNIHYHLVKYSQDKYKSTKSQKTSKKSIKSIKSKRSLKSRKHRSILKDRTILESRLGNYSDYQYKELEDLEDANILGYKVRQGLLDSLGEKKLPKSVKDVTDGFARGVARYALINFKLPHKTSNGYMKLWEIYATVPQLVQRKKQLNVFHLAEAPGQWINCTRHFIETKRQQVQHYNWLANSLNPTHPDNIAKYGKHIFGDDYGFLKRYPQKWLYGADDTGDITKSANVRWFRDYRERFVKKGGQPIHLITGDGGMGSGHGIQLEDLQKLDYAQMCMVAATSSIGGNCVIKHFHYLDMEYETLSKDASGFFVNYLYIYYLMFEEVRLIKPQTSSPNSGEFYVVGLRFRGVEDGVFNKLMKNLDDFKVNNCFFKKEAIPESFTTQIIEFVEKILDLNAKQFDMVNMLMTCIANPDPVIEEATQCRKYLDGDFIKKIQTKRYKEWIKTYGFR